MAPKMAPMTKISSAIRKEQVQRDGKCNIKIRIFHNGQKGYIATKFSVPSNQFEKGRVKKSHNLAPFLNKELKLLEADYENKILGIKNISKLSCAQLVERLTKKEEEAANFFEAINMKIIRLIPENKDDSKTWETYFNTRVNLKKYLGIKDNLKEKQKRHELEIGREEPYLGFSEMDEKFMNRFFEWHLTNGNSVNSAAVDFRNIRAVFNEAIDDGIISADIYPFRKFKIKTKKTRKRSLEDKKIKSLFSAKCEDEFEEFAQDVIKLVFFLIGINLKDLYHLKPTDYYNNRIVYNRAKTTKEYSIKVYGEAKVIIEKYRDEDGIMLLSFYKRYSTVHMFTKSVNKFIRRVAARVKIYEPLTVYYMRHSWATIAYNNGISKDTVKLALGHGSETVTDIYIDFDLKLVDEANRKVIDLVI